MYDNTTTTVINNYAYKYIFHIIYTYVQFNLSIVPGSVAQMRCTSINYLCHDNITLKYDKIVNRTNWHVMTDDTHVWWRHLSLFQGLVRAARVRWWSRWKSSTTRDSPDMSSSVLRYWTYWTCDVIQHILVPSLYQSDVQVTSKCNE